MELVRVKVNSCQLLIGDLYFGWIDIGVEICLNSQPCFGCSRRNEIDNHLVTDQRTPTPIHGNEREQAMFDLVPLAGPRWIMTYGHIQSRLIGPVLQFHLPESEAIPIATAAIRANQYLVSVGIKGMSHLAPPAANTFHGKTGRVMRTAHGHPAQVVFQIVHATRDCFGNIRIRKIMNLDLLGLPAGCHSCPEFPWFPTCSFFLVSTEM